MTARKKFLVVSIEGLASNICYRLKKEGNDVKFYIKNKEDRGVGDGIATKIDDWEKHVKWADYIIFDDTFFGKKQNELREEGYKVIGGSLFGDRIELERHLALKYFKEMDVNIPNTSKFESFDGAIRFLKEQKDKRFIIKFEGLASNWKDLCYLSKLKGSKDLISVLEHYKKMWTKKLGDIVFILQEVVEGVETAVSAYFNGEKFLMPVFVNFENKRLMNDEVGSFVGEMGEHGFWTNENLKLFDATLKHMEKYLKDDGYVGVIDMNCIINEKGVWPLEFTSRFGYPTIHLHFEAMKNKTRITDFFTGLVDRTLDYVPVNPGWQVGVVVVVPPYPHEVPSEYYLKGSPVVITDKSVLEHFHPGDLKMVNGTWVLDGSVGYGFIITGSGKTMQEAREMAYDNIGKVIVPNAMYRTDIGNRWLKDKPRLREWNFI